jgi:PAS domain S-box-containing protein
MDGLNESGEDLQREVARLRQEIADLQDALGKRPLAETASHESAAKYRMIFEHSPLGIFHYDQEGTLTACNENFVAIIGSSQEELIGLNLLRDLADERMVAAIRIALNGGMGWYEGTYSSVTARKSTPVRCRFSPLSGEDGTVVGGIGIIEDITDRMVAEAALAEREARYRQLVENAHDIIYVTDRRGRFILMNPMGLRVSGYSQEELLGKNYLELIPPDYRREVKRLYRRQFLDMTPETYYEIPLFTKEGDIVWLGQNVQLVMDEHGAAGFQAISRDITDRKKSEEALRQSEEKYRTIIENIEEGYFEVDIAGNMRFFNDALRRILGYTREELLGMDNRRFMDEATAKRVYCTFNEVYISGKPAEMFSWELIARDGETKSVETSVTLIRDHQGRPAGFRGILRDVTARKRAEALLLRSERLNAVGELATGVAHNFNNVLQLITGLAQLATMNLEQQKPALAAKHVTHVLRISQMAAETVKRLQRFAGLRTSADLSGRLDFDLSSVVRQATEVSQTWWKIVPEKMGILVTLTSSLADGCWVQGMESEIFEVAVNLIKNAVEALPDGGSINVSTHIEGNRAVLRVTDTGVGVSPEISSKIFEPFFTTKGFGSTGMGLASSYGIVTRQGGTIGVSKGAGNETVFTVTLPLVRQDRTPSQESRWFEPRVRARILIIDDMEEMVDLLSEGLTELGQTVVSARSGPQGLRAFLDQPVDLVICDLGMPGMNGLDVAAAIKDICSERGAPKTPLIILTGWGGQEVERESIRSAAVDAVLEKPVPMDKLLETIQRLILGGPTDENAP